MLKFKNQNKFKFKILKQKYGNHLFLLWIYFEFCALIFGFSNVYALNLDKVKLNFLGGDYKQAIIEGEKVLASANGSPNLDELYYFLGLSYLKDANYLRASDIFEIILKEYKNSSFSEEAKLGLGDTYLFRNDFARARRYYREILAANPNTKLKAQIYYRLSQAGFKNGDTAQAKEYLNKLKEEVPSSIESRLDKDIFPSLASAADFYYTVQVGSFSQETNARNLMQKLIRNNYPAYIEEIKKEGRASYRVRIGKFTSRQEAADLEIKLSREGYPTKIYP